MQQPFWVAFERQYRGSLLRALRRDNLCGGWWAGSVHFGGQAGEDGVIVLSVLVSQQPPGPCPDFLLWSSQLTLSESTQVDEYIQMWMTRDQIWDWAEEFSYQTEQM